jgi:hypothetical protein
MTSLSPTATAPKARLLTRLDTQDVLRESYRLNWVEENWTAIRPSVFDRKSGEDDILWKPVERRREG